MPVKAWTVYDEDGYRKQRALINLLIMDALVAGGKENTELMEVLRIAGVGDAKSSNTLELSYSSTGAIFRSAYNTLRSNGLVKDSFDIYGADYPKPLRIFRVGIGAPARPESQEVADV
jgi:hypothetical protein